jgi:hypothetical protein
LTRVHSANASPIDHPQSQTERNTGAGIVRAARPRDPKPRESVRRPCMDNIGVGGIPFSRRARGRGTCVGAAPSERW